MNRKQKVAVVVGAVVLALLGLGAYAFIHGFAGPPQIAFDASVWARNAHSEEYENPRWLMLDDLLAHHLRVGLPKADVLDLLGAPDEVSQDETKTLVYRLGMWHGIDYDYLWIRLDKSNRVTRCDHMQD